MNKAKWFSMIAVVALLLSAIAYGAAPARAEDSRFFPPTGHTVRGLFLDYWNTHGALPQQGYPISEELQEKSDTDGKVYTMQYFERAVFEHHPEFAGTPNEVLLSLLGAFYYRDKYTGSAPGQHTSADNPRLFNETGFTVGGAFRQYWETHGGLAQQGLPLSEEFEEISPTDGKKYTVQYFERAVFEFHPENKAPYNVLLSLLGVFYYDKKHTGGGGTSTTPTPLPKPSFTPQPTTSPQATTSPQPTTSPGPAGKTGEVLFYKKDSGAALLALVDDLGTLVPQGNQYEFGPGWTHVVSANPDNDVVLFYNSDTGVAMTYPLHGSLGDKKTFGVGAGWTSVTALGGDNVGGVLFYKGAGGPSIAMVGKVQVDGTFTTVKPNFTWLGYGGYYTSVAGASNGPVLGYVKSLGNGQTASVGSDGSLIPLKSYTTFSETWDQITPANNGVLIFSSQSENNVATGNIQYTGDFATLHSFVAQSVGQAGWSNVAATTNNSVLFYKSGTGLLMAGKLDNQGTWQPQQTHYVDAGWTQVIGIR